MSILISNDLLFATCRHTSYDLRALRRPTFFTVDFLCFGPHCIASTADIARCGLFLRTLSVRVRAAVCNVTYFLILPPSILHFLPPSPLLRFFPFPCLFRLFSYLSLSPPPNPFSVFSSLLHRSFMFPCLTLFSTPVSPISLPFLLLSFVSPILPTPFPVSFPPW